MFDFFTRRNKYLPEHAMEVDEVVNWGAVIGIIGGALVGNFVPWGIASINAMVVACLCYWAYSKIAKK